MRFLFLLIMVVLMPLFSAENIEPRNATGPIVGIVSPDKATVSVNEWASFTMTCWNGTDEVKCPENTWFWGGVPENQGDLFCSGLACDFVRESVGHTPIFFFSNLPLESQQVVVNVVWPTDTPAGPVVVVPSTLEAQEGNVVTFRAVFPNKMWGTYNLLMELYHEAYPLPVQENAITIESPSQGESRNVFTWNVGPVPGIPSIGQTIRPGRYTLVTKLIWPDGVVSPQPVHTDVWVGTNPFPGPQVVVDEDQEKIDIILPPNLSRIVTNDINRVAIVITNGARFTAAWDANYGYPTKEEVHLFARGNGYLIPPGHYDLVVVIETIGGRRLSYAWPRVLQLGRAVVQ